MVVIEGEAPSQGAAVDALSFTTGRTRIGVEAPAFVPRDAAATPPVPDAADVEPEA